MRTQRAHARAKVRDRAKVKLRAEIGQRRHRDDIGKIQRLLQRIGGEKRRVRKARVEQFAGGAERGDRGEVRVDLW